jgi:hypothetical protein
LFFPVLGSRPRRGHPEDDTQFYEWQCIWGLFSGRDTPAAERQRAWVECLIRNVKEQPLERFGDKEVRDALLWMQQFNLLKEYYSPHGTVPAHILQRAQMRQTKEGTLLPATAAR